MLDFASYPPLQGKSLETGYNNCQGPEENAKSDTGTTSVVGSLYISDPSSAYAHLQFLPYTQIYLCDWFSKLLAIT